MILQPRLHPNLFCNNVRFYNRNIHFFKLTQSAFLIFFLYFNFITFSMAWQHTSYHTSIPFPKSASPKNRCNFQNHPAEVCTTNWTISRKIWALKRIGLILKRGKSLLPFKGDEYFIESLTYTENFFQKGWFMKLTLLEEGWGLHKLSSLCWFNIEVPFGRKYSLFMY